MPLSGAILQGEVALATKKGQVGLPADWWTTEKHSTLTSVTRVRIAHSACGSVSFAIAGSASACFHPWPWRLLS